MSILAVVWIIIAVVLIVIDICTSTLLFVWISFGAFGAIIANYFGMDIWLQILIFSVVSIISVAIGYPWAKRKFKNKIPKTLRMEETYIGSEFVAQEDIEETVRFKVKGIYWTGQNIGGKIKKGEKFKIVGIDGNKLSIKAE